MQTVITPSGVVLLEFKNEINCGLNMATIPYKYGNKYSALWTCLECDIASIGRGAS